MAISLGLVMDQIGSAINGLGGLHVFDYPVKSAQPPFAFVNMPEAIEYDGAMQRGMDRMTIQVFVGVTDVVDRVSRDAVAAYAAVAGPSSVKAAIENAQIGSSVRVTRAEFGQITLASGTYAGVTFTLDVAA